MSAQAQMDPAVVVVREVARTTIAQSGHELAGASVLRGLPNTDVESIGPFVFLDHLRLVKPSSGLAAHPHAGIEVISYLMEGGARHSDSLGNASEVGAGGMQFISAGGGILHEEMPILSAAGRAHAIQLWTRLPLSAQYGVPCYELISPAEVPVLRLEQGELRLLGGEWWGDVLGQGTSVRRGPLPVARGCRLAHLSLHAGQKIVLPVPEHEELGVYVIEGSLALGDFGTHLGLHSLTVLTSGTALQFANVSDQLAEILILGGSPIEEPLVFGGPFVYDTSRAVQQAYENFRQGRMGRLSGVPF
ncbi:MAG: pirin family protein [Burkholderiales bacterium]|nr:pirin family protein [Burkholderiales bacterium]